MTGNFTIMAKETTYEEIARNLKNKIYSPVYFLMGEEDYYIDRISDYIMDTVLTETEKEFNLTLLYGSDTDIVSIINAARRYPMMSKYQVVIVREAHAAVHDYDVPAVLVRREVLADLVETAKGNDFQFFCHSLIRYSFF